MYYKCYLCAAFVAIIIAITSFSLHTFTLLFVLAMVFRFTTILHRPKAYFFATIAAFLFFVNTATAQRAGVFGGVSYTQTSDFNTIIISETDAGGNTLSYRLGSPTARVGLAVGAYTRFGYTNFRPFYLEAAARLSTEFVHYELRRTDDENIVKYNDVVRTHLDFPFYGGIKIEDFHVRGGVLIGITAPLAARDALDAWQELFNTGSLQYSVGVGYDFDRYTVDINLLGDTGQRNEAYWQAGSEKYNLLFHTRTIALSLSYKLSHGRD